MGSVLDNRRQDEKKRTCKRTECYGDGGCGTRAAEARESAERIQQSREGCVDEK